MQYATKQEIVLSQASQPVDVICQWAGKIGNCAQGETLTPVQPITGISSITVINISNGADNENREYLAARIETRVQRTPQGGSKQDYIRWALEVPGVTRAWPYPLRDQENNESLGLVCLAFVCDEQKGGIIPDANKVKEMQAHLEEKAPIPGDVLAFALTAKPLNLRIARLQPDNEATRQAIYEEQKDLLFREAVPGGKLLVSHIREAISIAIGEYDHELLFPLEDVVCEAHELLVMGSIAWGEDGEE